MKNIYWPRVNFVHIFQNSIQKLEIIDDKLRIQEASAPVMNVIEWFDIELIFFIYSELILFFDHKCHVTEAKGEILR